MTAINDAFLRAARESQKRGTDAFVADVHKRAKQIEKARRENGSRFRVLPEPAKKFDLRLVDPVI